MRTIACLFRQKSQLGGSPESLVAALNAYVRDDFAPAWGISAEVVLRDVLHPGDWPLWFLDDADQAGELGRHELANVPTGYVFVNDAQRIGKWVSEPASHEIAEMLADPWCNFAALDGTGKWVAMETADPVEGDVYYREGWPVSNFVLPAWFGGTAGPFDKLAFCKQAWEVRPGGYASVWKDGGWQDVFGSKAAAHAFACRAKTLRRYERRRRRWTSSHNAKPDGSSS